MYNDSEYFSEEERREIEKEVSEVIKSVSNEKQKKDSKFFKDTLTGLLEAVVIEKTK